MDDALERQRAQLAARRSGLSDAKKAALEKRLRALGNAPIGHAPAQTIPRAAERSGAHPASFAQQRLWFVDQLTPGSAAYNLGAVVELKGKLDEPALRRALAELVRRHDVLRSTLRQRGEEVEQVVADPSEPSLALHEIDLRALDASARAARRHQLARADQQRGFDLERGPLLRASLVALEDELHELHLMMHHIVSDGWSVGVLVNELGQLYAAYSQGAASPLAELPLQYGDVARWQRQRMSGALLDEQLAYWKKQLGGAPGVLSLGPARPRTTAATYAGSSVRATWDGELARGLREFGQREGATLFMVLLAGFQALLARWSGQRDVVVGSPVAGRNRPELEGLIGLFVNTLAMRTDLGGEPSFREAVRRVKETCLGAYAHQEVPFERLVEELHAERDLHRHPIYQVMFVLQNAPAGKMALPGLELRVLEGESETSKFDLTLSVEEEEGGSLAAAVEYSTELFDAAVAERLLAQLQVLLRGAVAQPDLSIEQLPLLRERDYAQVVKPWQPRVRGGALAHELVAARAAEHPERVAVVSGETRLTYRQLDERANQLARLLQQRGVGREVLVAISLERSEQMVIAVLAVWKAGGAYVPVDPAYPASRIAVMLEISKAPVIVTERWLAQPEWSASAQVVCLGEQAEELAALPATALDHRVHEDDLSHVIFTSGSTGTPKGVAVCHRSTRKRLEWARERYSDEELGGMLGSTSLSFDLSVYELWGSLAHGGKLILARNVLEYPELPAREEVRLINTVPSAMGELAAVHDLHGVVTVNLAGEALPRELVRTLYRKPTVTKVYNLYGPSEDTTYSTEELVPRDEDGRPAIGRPLPGTWTYIVDGHGQPVPLGVTGELFVAGEGLAREYLHRPDLTSDRFIANRFAPEGERMYKTGDLARYLEDGRIDYQGRVDHQVKIRGFRIELGDIEAALREEGLREAVVVARAPSGGGPMSLVAYASPASPGADRSAWPEPAAILAAIAKRLPAYMVPPALVLLDELPLTPNGKVDRKALPEPTPVEGARRAALVAPRDAVELGLLKIWKSLLRVEELGVTDDFFDVGGHSLRVLALAAEIERVFGRRLPIAAVYGARTIAGLAALLRQADVAVDRLAIPLREASASDQRAAATLFCVHPASGNAFVYETLARLMGEHGVYGVGARGLSSDEPHRDLVEMAAAYAAEIRAVQPSGPYALAGWSMGGTVAYEIARQLEAAGERVELLALLDTFAPPPRQAAAAAPAAEVVSDHDLLIELAQDYALPCDEAELRALDRDAAIDRLVAAAQRSQLLPAGAGRRDLDRVLRTYQANLAAVAAYRPEPASPELSQRMLVCIARESAAAPDAVATALGWAALCSAPPRAEILGTSHRTMVAESDAAEVAAVLSDRLEAMRPTL